MVYDPSTTWTAATTASEQAPVYFLRISGVSKDYSTAFVRSAGTTKVICAEPPSGGGGFVDFLGGSSSYDEVTIELLDVDNEITDLISVDASGAPVTALINRSATIYGGYRHMIEADYPPIYTGRITSLRANRDLTGYTLGLTPILYLLDKEIMVSASDATPVTVVGNPVNVYWSVMTGVFLTSHGTFPLTTFSTSTTTSAAPDGVGMTNSQLNETQN